MKCIKHTERGAAARCCVCGKPFCCECLTDFGGRLYCSEHAVCEQNMKRYSYKSRRRALLLCAVGLIGVGGLHRIYCGKILSGVIYFCTGGLLLAGTIADLLLILNRSFCDAGGRPLI